MHTGEIPRKRCKSHGDNKCDADPDHLFRIHCTKCDFVRDFDPDSPGAAKYLYHRRRTRAAQGLLSVGAPLDTPSAAYLCQAATECGIISYTPKPHVTFVEGLVPYIDHTVGIQRLSASLFADHTLRVVSVHRVTRRDNSSDLILADIILSPGADEAATELSDGRVCKLPQFPFHVTLGSCPRARGASKRAVRWAEARLKGVALSFDPRRIRVLPPPEMSRKMMMKQKRAMNTYHQQQQWQGHAQAHYQPAHVHMQHHYYIPTMPQQQMHQHQHHQQRSPAPGEEFLFPEQQTPATSSIVSSVSSDETDAASTSSSSSTSEEVEAEFPGLSVNLAFLDESDNHGADASQGCTMEEASAPQMNTYVPPMLTSIWDHA